MTFDAREAPLKLSVLMANYNGAAHLRQAIESVLAQSEASLELILVDDGSTDDSLSIARGLAADDSRLRIFGGQRLGGPAAVRNFALDQARGEWIAIVDSDDFIHPQRLERLLRAAEANRADIIVDDLIIFQSDGSGAVATMFRGALAEAPAMIDEETYVRANHLYGKGSALGYAKPLIRLAVLRKYNIRYNETLRIAEDYDLVLRLLINGATMTTLPELLYFYRKHDASISHRLDADSLKAMRTTAVAEMSRAGVPAAIATAHHDRLRSIDVAIDFDRLVTALKMKNLIQSLGIGLSNPAAAALLRLPVIGRLKAMLPKPKASPPDVAVIVRQRVVGATNGSSSYLLAICQYLKAQGRRVSLYWPTPSTFGRWPVLRLKPELTHFDDCRWRGGVRIGNLVFAKDARVYWGLAATAFEAVLLKLKLIRRKYVKPAMSALMAPSAREDFLFLAQHVRGAHALLADYAFSTSYLPYALSPDAPSLVVMHDLFSSRTDQFRGKDIKDLYGHLGFAEEMRLLGQADRVIAIQKAEAGIVDQHLKDQKAIVAPMASEPVPAFGPGDSDTVLFVGSNAAPNVLGLAWFFNDVWPLVLARRPSSKLKVAGTVGRNLPALPGNVEILGLVDDLAPLYREAGLIISPLTTGSGLKIKMVEALSHGKAAVVTGVTLQGIEDMVGDAVVQADKPQAFADAIVDLLDHPDKRLTLSRRAVDVVARHFSSEVCFRDIYDFIAANP